MDHLCYFCLLILLCFHTRLFIDALWSPAEEGLTSGLSFVNLIKCFIYFTGIPNNPGATSWSPNMYQFTDIYDNKDIQTFRTQGHTDRHSHRQSDIHRDT